MTCRPDPRPSFTPAPCDWIVHQMHAHALPALESELRKLTRWRAKVNTMLDCRTLSVEQRAELTFILDQLAKRGLIYNGEEEHPQNHERGEE